jgi:hypothetical protein
LTPREIETLLGKPKPLDPVRDPGPKPLPNSPRAKAEALLPRDQQYAIAIARERARIDTEKQHFAQQQDAKRGELETAAKAASDALFAAEEAYNQQQILAAQAAANPKWRNSIASPETTAKINAAYEAAKAGYAQAGTALQTFRDNYDQSIIDFAAPMEKTFLEATTLAQQLRDNGVKQAEFDAAFKDASSRYANAVTQQEKDQAAYDMYVAKKNMYDSDSANRQADIDAGRYAVNPYQFMAQGATLGEINDLRTKVNAGNLRPDMRVPDALVAPEEVKDPGDFKEVAPVHERVKDPTASAEAAAILGWKAPDPASIPADPEAPKVSSAETDTSSVVSGYKAPTPEDKVKGTGEAAAPAAPANNTSNEPEGAANLQQTSSASGSANTTQTSATQAPSAVAAAPAPALPAQPTGAVAGQANTTGQATTTPPPPVEEKPKPFAEDDGTKKEDHVW